MPRFGEDGTFTIPETTITPYPVIKKGDRGPTVAKWQRMMGVTADGNFGSGTDAATKKFQTAHGIQPDGVVGIQTWGAALQPMTPGGMADLELNLPSTEIPSPPAPADVIPPAVGIKSSGTTTPIVKPASVQAGMGSGFFGFIGNLPTWGKALLGIGAAAAVVSQGMSAGKSGRGKHQ